MASYLLLRNNKQTGPHSLEDLVKMGLKPYDLVWVEGRSAAWRYSSEIAELKSFAPIVEEQPYDRFFKKPSDETAKQEVLPEKMNVQEEPVKIIEEKKQEIHEAWKPKPNNPVFVSMPATTNSSQSQYEPKPVQQESYQPASYKSDSSYSSNSQAEEPALEKKYSQSLDEIKEMYVNTLQQRKTRNRRKELLKKYLKPVVFSIILIISGIVIGYFLTRKKVSLQASQGISTTVPNQKDEETPQDKNETLQPENKDDLIQQPENKNEQELNQQRSNQLQKEVSGNIQIAPKQILSDNKKDSQPLLLNNEIAKVQKRDVEIDPQTGERLKSVRTNNDDPVITTKENKITNNSDRSTFIETDQKDIRKLVSVKTNNYIRGPFGGIKDLELTVRNDSKFMVDEVRVELEYIKPSSLPLRTDVVTFKNISPNASLTIKVPDSQRGIRVDYHITSILSKQWEKNTAGL